MTLQGRADNYSKIFPKYPKLCYDKNWLYGVWLIGSCYKPKYGYYGEYPHNFLKRIYSLFPDLDNILHLFSGMIDEEDSNGGIRLDINPDLKPDIVGDVRDIKNIFKANKFDLVIADPPYTPEHAQKYGYKLPSKRQIVRDLNPLVKKGGFLCWFDFYLPIYRKLEWKNVGSIAVLTGTNRRVRILSIFQKNGE